jgi:hypothetical protein
VPAGQVRDHPVRHGVASGGRGARRQDRQQEEGIGSRGGRARERERRAGEDQGEGDARADAVDTAAERPGQDRGGEVVDGAQRSEAGPRDAEVLGERRTERADRELHQRAHRHGGGEQHAEPDAARLRRGRSPAGHRPPP